MSTIRSKRQLSNDPPCPLEAEAAYCTGTLIPAISAARELVDHLEGQVDRSQWPLPTYYDLLFTM